MRHTGKWISLLGGLAIVAAGASVRQATREPGVATLLPPATAHPAAVRPASPGDVAALPSEVVEVLRLDRETARKVAAFTLASGEGHELFVAERPTTGETCLIDVGERSTGSTCGGELFTRGRLRVIEAFDGGPRPESITELYIVGVADRGVGRIVISDSDGATHSPQLGAARAFVYEHRREALRRGVTPIAVTAFDAAGATVSHEALGPPSR